MDSANDRNTCQERWSGHSRIARVTARKGRYLIIGDSNLSGLDRPMDQSSPPPGPGIKRPRSMALAAHVFPKRPQSFPHNRGYLGSEISRVPERTEHYSVSDACSLRRGQLMPDLSTTPLLATILVACPTLASRF